MGTVVAVIVGGVVALGGVLVGHTLNRDYNKR